MTFFEAVQIRDKLKQRGDIVATLGGRYVKKDGKDFICTNCRMYLSADAAKNVMEHFAFQHTADMSRMLKD